MAAQLAATRWTTRSWSHWFATALPRATRLRHAPAPDRLLRCCVLKHLKGWSFRDVERELRSNLVYRRFTHFYAEATPDFTSFSRLFALLGPSVTEKAVAQA